MKKTIRLVAMLSAVLLLCSCAASPISEKDIAVISSQGEVLDNNYNQLVWEGVCRYADKADVSFLSSKNPYMFSENLNNLIEKKTDLIWCTDGAASQTMKNAASEYPDLAFACADASFEGATSNLTGISFRGNEGAFIAGYIAARTTTTQKVGFVGGANELTINEFEHGFKQGAMYVNPKINVFIDYIGSYTDTDKGTAIARAQYDKGADIIFQAAGTAGLGVVECAKSMNKFVIGVDNDQSALAPQNVLVSVTKMTNVAVADITGRYLAGEDIGGKNFEFGLADGGVDIVPNGGLVDSQILSEAMIVKSQIIDGTITVLK